MLAGRYRKPTGVRHPTQYAPPVSSGATSFATAEEKAQAERNAYLFNCAQRAHGNFLENQPSILGALLITGLKYPLVASALGAGWIVNRVIYTLGYVAKDGVDGKKRTRGMGWAVCQLALIGTSVWTAVSFVRP